MGALGLFTLPTVPFSELLRTAIAVSEDMTEDLEYFQAMYSVVENFGGGGITDELFVDHVDGMRGAISAYLVFAGNILNPEPGKSKSR